MHLEAIEKEIHEKEDNPLLREFEGGKAAPPPAPAERAPRQVPANRDYKSISKKPETPSSHVGSHVPREPPRGLFWVLRERGLDRYLLALDHLRLCERCTPHAWIPFADL